LALTAVAAPGALAGCGQLGYRSSLQILHMSAPTERARARPADSSYAGLVWTLVRTDFKTRFHGTLGGFFWTLLKPLAMFLTLVSVFSFVFRTEPDYRVNLLLGLFIWDFFAEATKIGVGALHAKGFLIARAKFPRWILVVTTLSNPLCTLLVFAVSILVYLTATAASALSPTQIALFLSYLLACALVCTGFGLAASVLYFRYRDLNQVWEVATQAGFFFAPIVWPIGTVPERFHFLLYLWPPTPIIEFSRDVLVRGVVPSATAHVLLAVETVVVLALGVLVYRRLSPRVAEEL
jgi:ABC-type polysaccharide/polyol phosphate export permease